MARRSDHTREQLNRMALDAARAIVERDGLRGLSTRGIAGAIGYSPGTLYQLFADLDDLICNMNADTLEALIEACRGVDLDQGAETSLLALAGRYIGFVEANASRWNAVFEHSLPAGRDYPERYRDAVAALLGMAERCVAGLFTPEDETARHHHARVMWASLHGITSLAVSGKLAETESAEAMAASLARHYLAGLRALQRP